MIRDYKNIVAWQRAHAVTLFVYKHTKFFFRGTNGTALRAKFAELRQGLIKTVKKRVGFKGKITVLALSVINIALMKHGLGFS